MEKWLGPKQQSISCFLRAAVRFEIPAELHPAHASTRSSVGSRRDRFRASNSTLMFTFVVLFDCCVA